MFASPNRSRVVPQSEKQGASCPDHCLETTLPAFVRPMIAARMPRRNLAVVRRGAHSSSERYSFSRRGNNCSFVSSAMFLREINMKPRRAASVCIRSSRRALMRLRQFFPAAVSVAREPSSVSRMGSNRDSFVLVLYHASFRKSAPVNSHGSASRSPFSRIASSTSFAAKSALAVKFQSWILALERARPHPQTASRTLRHICSPRTMLFFQ